MNDNFFEQLLVRILEQMEGRTITLPKAITSNDYDLEVELTAEGGLKLTLVEDEDYEDEDCVYMGGLVMLSDEELENE